MTTITQRDRAIHQARECNNPAVETRALYEWACAVYRRGMKAEAYRFEVFARRDYHHAFANWASIPYTIKQAVKATYGYQIRGW